jgi:hypothetical protein
VLIRRNLSERIPSYQAGRHLMPGPQIVHTRRPPGLAPAVPVTGRLGPRRSRRPIPALALSWLASVRMPADEA